MLMKTNRIILTVLGLFVLIAFVSCPGAPPAQEDIPPIQPEAPRPVPPPDPATLPPDQATLNALNAAVARAEAARQLVSDFGGQEYFPSDWDSAESLYSQAQQQRRTSTGAETRESEARFLRAAEAFEAMAEKTLARYYENLSNELNLARAAAINAGAQALVPDLLLEADNKVADAEEKFQARNYQAARDTAGDALNMYAALRAGLEAYKIREEIAEGVAALVPEYLWDTDDVGLDAIGQWDAGNYLEARAGAEQALTMYSALKAGLEAYRIREEIAEGVESVLPEVLWQTDDVGLDALDKWDDGDYLGAKTGAETASTMYAALRSALRAYLLREEIEEMAEQLLPQTLAEADDVALDAIDQWEAGDFHAARASADRAYILYLRTAASTERQRALDLRANMAAELEFTLAQDIYNRANMAFHLQWDHDAIGLFTQCRTMFRNAAELALQRRRVAEENLRRADQRLAESDEIARNVESLLQGGIQ
jgi:hypothetical protein